VIAYGQKRAILMKVLRLSTLPVFAVLIFAAGAIASASDWEAVEEYWYEIEISGAIAGWSTKTISRANDRQKTATHSDMRLRRGDATVNIVTDEIFIERMDGTPISMKRTDASTTGPIEHEWQFGANGVTHVIRQLGRETKRERPLPEGVWLTPLAAARYIETRRHAGATEIVYRTITPDVGLMPITVTAKKLRDDVFTLDDRIVPVTVWQREFDAMPLVVIEHISTDVVVVKQEIELGAVRMVLRFSNRERIERWIAERQAAEAPDLLFSNLVTPNRRIERVHAAHRATFRVSAANGERPDLPTTGLQRVEPDGENDRAVIVTIDVDEPAGARKGEGDREEYRLPSSLIDFGDEQVRRLARIDPAETSGAMAIARHLRQRVHRHITVKTLDVAFASASETAITRRGDCTEHAVLLAALLRANDIPARVATGLVYADHFEGHEHVFGWHMWTQAYIDGRWWDFDSVLPGDRFHAGYVLVSTSALSDDERYAGLSAIFELLGNVAIEVIDVEYR
jgi:hypothetical protein